MRVATYNRKSVYSDHSDSVKNQERMCRDHAQLRFGDQMESFTVYQDEGFSGANTERPGLKRLLADINAGKIDALVVYQLDRISRSVKDFSDIWDKLEKKGVSFVSIKEQIDTETPMGRAMIFITMVFAQMERETIAERVTDNAKGLAMKGLWPHGSPPLGYILEPIVLDGKKHYRLAPDPEKAAYVKNLFADMLSLGKSVQALAKSYAATGKTSVTGKYPDRASIYRHLTSPYCCAATQDVYDYWEAKGCRIVGPGRDEWDGTKGVMVFGTLDENHAKRDYSEWIITKGLHEPLVSAEDWLAVQAVFQANIFDKTTKYPPPLLKGILRCAKCGRLMIILRGSKGIPRYMCNTRHYRGITYCDMPSLKASDADPEVEARLREAVVDEEVLKSFHQSNAPSGAKEKAATLMKGKKDAETKLENLAAALAEAGTSSARKYILAEMDKVEAGLIGIIEELEKTSAEARKEEASKKEFEEVKSALADVMGKFQSLSAEEKNGLMKKLLKTCTWDGTKVTLVM